MNLGVRGEIKALLLLPIIAASWTRGFENSQSSTCTACWSPAREKSCSASALPWLPASGVAGSRRTLSGVKPLFSPCLLLFSGFLSILLTWVRLRFLRSDSFASRIPSVSAWGKRKLLSAPLLLCRFAVWWWGFFGCWQTRTSFVESF